MNIARPWPYRIGTLLCSVKQPFTYRDLEPLMEEENISYGKMRKALHFLEKQDVLVRIAHGTYMTMEAYKQRGDHAAP